MLDKQTRRAELGELVIRLLWDVGPEAALPYAEELAAMINDIDDWQSRQEWVAIWTVRGRLDRAIEIGEQDLEYQLTRLISFDPSVRGELWFKDEVSDVLDVYYLQADRYTQLGIPGAAKRKMQEAFALSVQFSVPFDEHLQTYYESLCEETDG